MAERKTVNGVVYELQGRNWVRVGGTPRNVTTMTPAERDAAGLRADQRGGGGLPTIEELMALAAAGGGAGTTSAPAGYQGQPLSEQLALMAEKYKWDSKLELEVLMKEYEQRGKLETKLIGLNFKNQKWLADRGYSHDVTMADLNQQHRLDYLQQEIGLTKNMKIELMEVTYGYDVLKMDKQFDFEKLMAADDRTFQSEQKGLDRDLSKELSGMDIASREAISAAQIAAQLAVTGMTIASQEKIAGANIASQEGMQIKGFTHAEMMQVASQAFDKEMQKRGFAHDFGIQAKELSMRLLLANKEIKSQEKIAENRNEHEKEMQASQQAFDKEQKEEDRKLRRFEEVQQLRGKDPVRAALMAMGAGDATDAFGGTFGKMDSMVIDGVDVGESLKADTESALQGIEGLGAAGETLTLGDTGLEGLQSVEKAGKSFVQGTTGTRTLIQSAQGVGGSTQAGVSEEDVASRVAAITPKGFQQRAAAGGIGPVLTPMVQQQYAAVGRGPTVAPPHGSSLRNAPRSVDMGANRPAVQPNTSYTVGEGQKGDGTRPEVVTTGVNKELLSIEPATADFPSPGTLSPTDSGRVETDRDRIHREAREAQGTTLPVNAGGDPLIDMFNDPNLTINRGDQKLPPISQGRPIQAPRPQDDPAIKAQRISTIKDKLSRGEPLTPEEEAEWAAEVARGQSNTQQPGLTNIINSINPVGLQGQRSQQLQMQAKRQEYLAQLPPAQQAALRQSGKQRLGKQQEQLTNNLTPQTIEKLMQLINNPNREVNTNLQEVLPQIRDGAGNVAPQPQNLARVV